MYRRKFLMGLGTISALPLMACGFNHESDRVMIANLYKNKALFEQLIAMARSEVNIDRIEGEYLRKGSDQYYTYPAVPEGFTLERWNNYRGILKRLELERLEFMAKGAIWLHASFRSFSFERSRKGYVWSPSMIASSNLSESLPIIGRLPVDSGSVGFRGIEHPWYLFYRAY
jgi:hypothetical protein